jgi:hypothetical protein
LQQQIDGAKRQQEEAAKVVAARTAELNEFNQQFDVHDAVNDQCWRYVHRLDRGAGAASTASIDIDDEFDEDYVPNDDDEGDEEGDEEYDEECDADEFDETEVAVDAATAAAVDAAAADDGDDDDVDEDYDGDGEGDASAAAAKDTYDLADISVEEHESESNAAAVTVDNVSIEVVGEDEWGLSTLRLESASTVKNISYAPKVGNATMYCKFIDEATLKLLLHAESMSQKASYEMYVLFCLAQSIRHMQAKAKEKKSDDNGADVESHSTAPYWRLALVKPIEEHQQKLTAEFVSDSMEQLQKFAQYLHAPLTEPAPTPRAAPQPTTSQESARAVDAQKQPAGRSAKRRKSADTADRPAKRRKSAGRAQGPLVAQQQRPHELQARASVASRRSESSDTFHTMSESSVSAVELCPVNV